MQTPSEARTKIIPIKNPRMLIKVRPLLNGCIRITWHTSYKTIWLSDMTTWHTSYKTIWLSDMTDQEALALQAAINDALIEFDSEETHK